MQNRRLPGFFLLKCAALMGSAATGAAFATSLQSESLPGDVDGNGVVDLSDYLQFNIYTNGPDADPTYGDYLLLDLDADADVDLADFADMQNSFTGHDLCISGTCVECLNDADCDDADVCTNDVCENDHTCSYTDIGGCCNFDSECDDGLDCTSDVCKVDHTCAHTQIPGCITHTFATFTDSDSEFATQDVRDVDNEIVHFDSVRKSIVYVATGVEYQVGSWTVNGNLLGGGFFQVRFGTVLGEHRAYFTETGSGTICNFVVTPTSFSIFATSTQVPHT